MNSFKAGVNAYRPKAQLLRGRGWICQVCGQPRDAREGHPDCADQWIKQEEERMARERQEARS